MQALPPPSIVGASTSYGTPYIVLMSYDETGKLRPILLDKDGRIIMSPQGKPPVVVMSPPFCPEHYTWSVDQCAVDAGPSENPVRLHCTQVGAGECR